MQTQIYQLIPPSAAIMRQWTAIISKDLRYGSRIITTYLNDLASEKWPQLYRLQRYISHNKEF